MNIGRLAFGTEHPCDDPPLMLRGIRTQLSYWLLPKDERTLFLLGANLLAVVLKRTGGNSATWSTSDGREFELYDVTKINAQPALLRCVVCTCEFHSDPDRPARCPSCNSLDLELV